MVKTVAMYIRLSLEDTDVKSSEKMKVIVLPIREI